MVDHDVMYVLSVVHATVSPIVVARIGRPTRDFRNGGKGEPKQVFIIDFRAETFVLAEDLTRRYEP